MSDWKPSSYSQGFSESATLGLAARAKRMKAEGRSIINFSVGEPDFNTPDSIIEAAYRAAQQGDTKYTAVAGTTEAREAVAKRLSEDYGVGFKGDQVVLSTGGKQAIFHFLQSVLEPGDEVLIPSPYWTSFPEMVKMCRGKPVILPSSEGRLTPESLEQAMTEKSRVLIFNSPANPHGVVYKAEEIEAFLDVLSSSRIWLLSDDTYYTLTYGREFVSALKLRPGFAERTAVIGSLSKSYAMTGWRLGWAVVPTAIQKAMAKIQGQVTSGPNSLSQAAAVEALGASHEVAVDFKERFHQRRDFLLSRLEKDFPEMGYMPPEGAFYCFLKLSDLLKGESVTEFCERLLQEKAVCLVPGEAFGEPEYARLSYALSEEQIEEGLERLRSLLF